MRGNTRSEFIVLDFGTKRPRVSEPNVAPVGRRHRRREANESIETSGERAPSASSDD